MAKRDRDRDPMPLGALLPALVTGRGWGERMALGRLLDSWEVVAGAVLAVRSRPVGLSRGVLTVRAEGGAWATELTLLGPQLAARANAFLESDLVHQVKVSART